MQPSHPWRMGTPILLALLALSTSAQSTFWVDAAGIPPGTGTQLDPFVLIQDGIDAAAPGDTVRVAPGTYVENVDFSGKDVVVRGDQGPQLTTISGGNAGVTVTFAGGEGPGARLEGFTIIDGDIESLTEGGGIRIQNASPVIVDCVVTQCQGPRGGGIVISNGAPHIEACTVTANTASSLGVFGLDLRGAGGICVGNGAAPAIVRCTISNNSGAEGAGGGLDVIDAAAFVSHTIITGNFGGNSPFLGGIDPGQGGAGGVHVLGTGAGAVCTLINCLIAKNTGGLGITQGPFVGTGGGGAVHSVNASLTVTNGTIEGNHGGGGASAASGGAGGVHLRGGGPPSILTNTVVWGNLAPSGAPSSIVDEGLGATVDFCCVEGGYAGVANVAADPEFIDALLGNHRLSATSPCIDAGDDAAPLLPPDDLDGNPRISYLVVDMGAYEYGSGCFTGTVGISTGGPVPVLHVDGQYQSTVVVAPLQPFNVGLDQPPGNVLPAEHVVFLKVGPLLPFESVPTPLGTLCFDPNLGLSIDRFILMTSLPLAGPVLFPFVPQAPVVLPLPPIPGGVEFSLQGAITDQPGAFAITNLVHVQI